VAGAGRVPDPELLEHGRGLFITLGAFDAVRFNEAGNQVTLVKYFGRPALAAARVSAGASKGA
jgi:anti-sigma regulatory factor (Ser/Thr protein kinase)